jgi:hypothetical protein
VPLPPPQVAEAIAAEEMDWSAPRPADWLRGGEWGSQRTVLFAGLPLAMQVGAPLLQRCG